jgi:DegV family protein with EDD domain
MPSHRLEIITDSTCDIPQDLIDNYKIHIIPIPITWGNDQLLDRIDLSPEKFYERLESDPIYPSTSLLTEFKYAETYREAKAGGAEEILMVSLTGALSNTIDNARKAASAVDIPVHVVDSGYVSMGEGFQVLKAARMRDAGEGIAVILKALTEVHRKMVLFAALDTVKYILKGGRVGNVARMIESVLDIKPLVTFDNEDGKVYPSGFARTRRKSIEQMYSKFFETLDHKRDLHICVMHGGAKEDALNLVDRIKQEFNPKEILLNFTGTALGMHTGPRALGLIGYPEE